MRYLIWLLRAMLFVILLGLAVKNDQPVAVQYFLGFEWHASLIVVMLLFFAMGVGVGVLSMLGNIFRQRKEITSLKREVRLKKAVTDEAVTSDNT